MLWGGSALAAAGIAFVVAVLLDAAAGSSLALGVLTEGYNHTVISDLRQEGFAYTRTALGAFLITTPLSLLLNTFLTGGILATILQQRRLSVWHFVASSLAYAGRFFRLVLLGLALLLVLCGLLALLVVAGALGTATEKELAERAGAALMTLVVFGGLGWTVMDYARLWIVRERVGSVRRAFWWGLRLVAAHPLATGTLQLAGVAMLVATVGVQALLASAPFEMGSLGGILAVAALHQVVVFARSCIRLALIGSQVSLTNQLLPPVRGEER